jgi:uncharacterized surface protein with fasciclin (FAS1) repeats
MMTVRLAGVGLAAVALLSLAACGGTGKASSGKGAEGSTASSAASAPESGGGAGNGAPAGGAGGAADNGAAGNGAAAGGAGAGGAAAGNGVTTAADVFGPACGKLPQGNAPGSLNAMGPLPVATAASTNPLLTKLVAAIKATKLVDAVNGQPSVTVFAPADTAFQRLGDAKFNQLASNPNQLAPILEYHVVPKRYDAKGLEAAKTVNTLNGNGGALRIEGSGANMTVNGAKVLCGNIPTRNATVFVIDSVLTPGANK